MTLSLQTKFSAHSRAVSGSKARSNPREPMGEYIISDAQLDKEIAGMNFNELFIKAKNNQGLTYDDCQRELARITRSLSKEFAGLDEENEFEVRKKRYGALFAYDPECPSLVQLRSAHKEGIKPDLGGAISGARTVAALSSQDIVARTEKWFRDLESLFSAMNPA